MASLKDLDSTSEDVLAEAAKFAGFERGSRRQKWQVRIWTKRNVLRATLACDGGMLLGLDHHATPGAIAMGYHWDVHPPLIVGSGHDHARIHIDPQPSTVEDALEMLGVFWNLRFIDGTERLL